MTLNRSLLQQEISSLEQRIKTLPPQERYLEAELQKTINRLQVMKARMK